MAERTLLDDVAEGTVDRKREREIRQIAKEVEAADKRDQREKKRQRVDDTPWTPAEGRIASQDQRGKKEKEKQRRRSPSASASPPCNRVQPRLVCCTTARRWRAGVVHIFRGGSPSAKHERFRKYTLSSYGCHCGKQYAQYSGARV